MLNEIMLVPIPIFSKSREVIGYRFSYRIGNALLEEGKVFSGVTALPFFDFINKVGLEALTYNKMVFVPVTDVQLAVALEYECKVDRAMIALTLDKSNGLSDSNLRRIRHFKEQGFKLAFYNVYNIMELEAFMPYTDYVFCDHKSDILMPIIRYVRSRELSTTVIAINIESINEFDRALFFGVELMEGQFYKYPAHLRNEHVSPLQFNYIQLLEYVNRADFDFNEFSKIILRDTALTLQFLRLVNSSAARMSKITSLRHAAAMLGQNDIRRWIRTAVTNMLSRDKPGELTRISLLRAKFCENIAPSFQMAVHVENLFLTGLLSVLDAIMDMSM
ncbi:MAG: HDOD domain-containing protein, partial [Oscillospiraceae bacterium]|nr:HDOD domain-containing protein [Oscillospiraceae bacterium]